MSNRFVDNVTPLDAEILNKFEEDLKTYADERQIVTATRTTKGGIKIWMDGATLHITTT